MFLTMSEAVDYATTTSQKQVLAELRKYKDSFQGIIVSQLDKDMLSKLIIKTPSLQNCYNDLLKFNGLWGNLVEDIFFSLLKSEAILLDTDQIHYQYLPFYTLFSKTFAESEQFRQQAEVYRDNLLDTALMLEEIIKKFINMYQQDVPFQNKMEQ